jgi:hypothetical protein
MSVVDITRHVHGPVLLPASQCAMDPATRAAFGHWTNRPGRLAPALLAHRDMMYAEHLALPLAL